MYFKFIYFCHVNVYLFMKRIVLILLLLCSLTAKSQWTIKPSMEYDYTRTLEHSMALGVLADYQLHETTMVGMGFQAASQGRYSLDIKLGTKLFDMKYGELFLENRYLYRLFPKYDIQEFTALLNLAYISNHLKLHLGLFNRYYGAIPLRKNGGSATIFEPMNVAFAAEAILFKPSHHWNLSVRLSNFRDFCIERFSEFFYSLKGYYDIKENIRLDAELGLHPSGTMNLTSQPNGIFIKIGMIYKFNN